MNKKQLRQRILDVAAGVGMGVCEYEDRCMWEWHDDAAVDLQKLVQGLRRAFSLENDCFLVHINFLDDYKDPETLVDFFWRNRGEL